MIPFLPSSLQARVKGGGSSAYWGRRVGRDHRKVVLAEGLREPHVRAESTVLPIQVTPDGLASQVAFR